MIGEANSEDLAITLGVEEEFFLVDPGTRDLLTDPDQGIFDACETNSGPHKVVREFLRSQIETATMANLAQRSPGLVTSGMSNIPCGNCSPVQTETFLST